MIISSQGFGHFTQGMNNQDFGIESPRMLLILDGCSGARYSEVGTRLFAQLFSRKEEWDSVEKFENNVETVFKDILDMMKKYYSVQDDLEKEFIMENLLFTIIACFETEESFIVKLFGDGYIISQNTKGCVSYMRFSYGKCPPYFAYRHCNLEQGNFKDYTFKTFVFDKKVFPKIAIATDGIMPIAKGDIQGVDRHIVNGNITLLENAVRTNRPAFYDDVTIGVFGGEK